MQIHQLQQIHKSKQKKRVGRGGAHGFHAGKGNEGQKSRAGKRLEPLIRGFIKRYPKLRGYKFKSRGNIAIVNLETLEKKFNAGDKVAPLGLLDKKIISRIKGKVPEIKILGIGGLTKKLIIEGCLVSKTAKEKIEKAGGAIK